jgi:hypothetical protein
VIVIPRAHPGRAVPRQGRNHTNLPKVGAQRRNQ